MGGCHALQKTGKKMEFESEIGQSISYLDSKEAHRALDADAYWPKWHSPWWHMLTLHEMGHTSLIPQSITERYVAALNRIPLKIFPIHPEDMPAGVDPFRGTPCHCQLGNVYQVLATRGVDVDAALPWIRPWFLRYQMADGGLNCDNDSYLVKDECPSSMVGTIAAFEAILLHTPRPWTDQERAFLDNGASFLIGRELKLGSSSKHNEAERVSAESWTRLCFPRFYFYDVLRGLNALLLWAEKTRNPTPAEAMRPVVELLSEAFRDGSVRPGRQPWQGAKTLKQSPRGEWLRLQDAATFPLLDAVSVIGEASPYLTRQWTAAKRLITLR